MLIFFIDVEGVIDIGYLKKLFRSMGYAIEVIDGDVRMRRDVLGCGTTHTLSVIFYYIGEL